MKVGDDMGKEEVKHKIILTTIECIEQEGIQGATIRKIADMAGVNVAAINYHFGSKEQLFEIVMNATLNESFVNNIKDYEDLWKSDTRKALHLFLEETLQGAINYPNLTKAHLAKPFIKNDFNTNSVIKINEFLTEFHGLIKNILRSEDDLESKMSAVQLFSSILIIGMMPGLFDKSLGNELRSSENQKKFIKVLIENHIK